MQLKSGVKILAQGPYASTSIGPDSAGFLLETSCSDGYSRLRIHIRRKGCDAQTCRCPHLYREENLFIQRHEILAESYLRGGPPDS